VVKAEIILTNETGLHARPASLFVKEAAKYGSTIHVVKDGKTFNAKSIMSILSMGAGMGSKLEIIVDGEDEAKALSGLLEVIESFKG
jgi:phosphocarrier protein HPr